ncbi:MAG TPA: beta-ketoacyl-ACP synthase III [Abditibacteriaceae bacterium]|jgi:3-oxoacyl-[acyl-carrier-protein] synthase-3
MSNSFSAGITGLGHYVPAEVRSNADLVKFVDTNDEWIRSRTGIEQRHIVAEGETTTDLAVHAATRALENAGLTAADIDLIIVATCTPDYPFPSVASLVQDRLGANCGGFDLGAACAGFTYALVTAAQFIQTGAMKNILVIGAEAMSRIVDWSDRNTCILFGDGAGAVVLSRVPDGYGMLGFDLGSDGSGGPLLKVAAYEDPTVNGKRIYQAGREVYKFAVHVMGESAVRALGKANLSGDDVDLLVPHQANIRIVESAAKRLGLPMEKVFVNLQKYGNTSAASIPLALSEAHEAGLLQRDKIVVTVGFGGGLAWSGAALRWY